MDTKLIFYDMEKFLEKYTRFMTKNIYITNKTYQKFISQYQYLFQILEKEGLLYDTNPTYQQVINIKKNTKKIIRLHNQKYLKKMVTTYQSFFDNIYSKDILDLSKRSMILCEEENMLCVTKKNQLPLIIGKIKYLIEEKQINPSKILVLGDSHQELSKLKEYWYTKENPPISIINIEEEKTHALEEEETLLTPTKKYQIIKNYLTEILFPNQKVFSKFYKTFQSHLYLNQDYSKYKNFSDYHNYLYQRKYQSSKLSLKKYNEQTIKKRKNYLRTICNEFVNTKSEVDIANFFYLNCIPYQYDKNTSSFYIYPEEQNYHIYFKQEEQNYTINQKKEWILYEKNTVKKTYLETLIYELIKRRCPLEKRREEELFEQLKETSKDSYFSTAITNILLPAIEYYQIHKSFKNTNITPEEQKYLLDMFLYYQKYLEGNYLVDEKILLQRIKKRLQKENYSHIMILGNIDLKLPRNIFQVISNLEDNHLLKENIKLFIEYQKTLQEQTMIPIPNTYLSMQEYQKLTNKFISEHLAIINQNLYQINKNIYVSFYNDKDKFLINKQRILETEKIIQENNIHTIIIHEHSQINLLIEENIFIKINNETLKNKTGIKLQVEELNKMNRIVDKIILPFFALDRTYQNFSQQNNTLKSKMTLLNALSKCRKELYIVCPKSSKEEILQLLNGLKNVHIDPKIPV